MTFFDVTDRSVDIGLYAGACSQEYKDYTLMITPANGCGTSQAFSDTDLQSWPMADPSDKESTYRIWPFAAMDYYIELYQTPDVSALTESVLLKDNVGAECTPPGTDIMQFFRDRNLLVQTLKLLDRTEADAVYRGTMDGCAPTQHLEDPSYHLLTYHLRISAATKYVSVRI